MRIRPRSVAVPVLLAILSLPAVSAPLRVPPPRVEPGDRWTSETVVEPAALPVLEPGFEHRVLWDLRPRAGHGSSRSWLASSPEIADRTIVGELPGTLTAGDPYAYTVREADGSTEEIVGKAVAEGVALLPLGVREGLLLRESVLRDGEARLRYRFVDRSAHSLADLEGAMPAAGAVFVAESGTFVTSLETLADDGLQIPYQAFSDALIPGSTGFLQYSQVADRTLSQIHPAWTSVSDMISVDATSVAYQPDPGDPASEVVLPEVWDFSGLATSELTIRTFNSTRADQAGQVCINGCSTQDLSANPPDGTWQYYLKIDTYDAGNALFTQDFFALNDNDTGANPSIDVSFTIQDTQNTEDTTQVCFAGSAGGADRFLQFFEFQGADPASAVMGVGDVWSSGSWSSCSGSNGVRLTAASICGTGCYPTCSAPQPFARGRLPGNAGFRNTILEDAFVKMPTGNYIPALLMLQETNLQAGIDFIAACALGSTPQRAFDYFWISERYGLLASVSSPNNETMPAGDWSGIGNVTDGVDFTWGPYPPHQFTATACLSGTRVEWALPADGSNIGTGPVSDYGYVVAWGADDDPEGLADFGANPGHSPLPGAGGYLAAPPGSEPTGYTITGQGGGPLNVTVVTMLQYTDPDVSDVTPYRSAAYYKVALDSAELDPMTFAVGEVAPLVDKQGSDLVLAWPSVASAADYAIRVWDLDTDTEIACPAGLDCSPAGSPATFTGGAADVTNYGFRVLAVDACGGQSLD